MGVLDSMCIEALQKAPHAAIPWYLMSSYTYYCLNRPLLSDGFYDHLGRTMLQNWEFFQHVHKHLITPDDLAAGTLHRLRAPDYPPMCRSAAESLLEKMG